MTPIENLIDLEVSTDRVDTGPIQVSGNKNFAFQMERETMERDVMSSPLKSKIRNNVDFRAALNGGSDPYTQNMRDYFFADAPRPGDEYMMGPRAKAALQQASQPMHDEIGPVRGIQCLDVCRHISGCPLCSKFYDNDRGVYIVIIVILIIAIIVLCKKLVDKM